MSLRKDDPVYYKKKLKELFEQAHKNGIEVELNEVEVIFSNSINEKAIVWEGIDDANTYDEKLLCINR